MITAYVYPFAIHEGTPHDLLIVRYRTYNDGTWSKNGFWRFLMPTHEQDIFERAYIETNAQLVYMQLNYLLYSDDGVFYS